MSQFRGTVERRYAVTCGECVTTVYTATSDAGDAKTLAEAHKAFRDAGWKSHRRIGWICPECQKSEKGE